MYVVGSELLLPSHYSHTYLSAMPPPHIFPLTVPPGGWYPPTTGRGGRGGDKSQALGLGFVQHCV